ncbi:HD family phosphohydrolase [Carboxylicivirga sp. N1Y90]|uniref:HD family phosphohydrolase n=1 Tax=Carboxylicivirga fragile TaxID=3417571 RepID=UPI003D32A628|nr:HDIG domain-containing protein [Marinilabiliaceae bacterium N1Y90]
MLDRFKNFKSKYYQPGLRIFLFLITTLIITYLLPKTGKFAYEYVNGTPWKHQTLIAPFDFPIYKTQAELTSESDSLLHHFRPYFNRDTAIKQKITEQFAKDYPSIVEKNKADFRQLNRKYSKDTTYFDQIGHTISEQLKQIYSQGIIVLPEQYLSATETFELMLIEGAFAEPYALSELYLQTQAYQRISTSVIKTMVKDSGSIDKGITEFITELQLNNYIDPNIRYDEARNITELDNLQKNISLTSGRVLAGQRIIDQGGIVDKATVKVLDSLRRNYESKISSTSNYYFILGGQFLIVFLLFVTIYLFLYFFRRDVFQSISSVSFILLITLLMTLLASLEQIFPHFPFYIIPFAILPIIIRTFFDSRLAFFMYVITILISAFFTENSFEFVFLQIPAGLIAMFSLFRMVRRSHIVRAAMLIILTYSLFYTSLSLWREGNINTINVSMYAYFGANGIMLLMVYPLIWIFERMFGFLSDVTLVELSDTNHPILRKMAEATPGTFQHSIQVGNLAQEVAYKLGANPALVRAGAMYHDIGKMASPMFFTENQAQGLNPHSELSYEDSAKVVINHIDNGVKMALKHKLPRQIIDFITTHQGTTKTWYFYNSFINKNPDQEPDVSIFTYPGPTPFTLETAILMMADSIEAASRSLKKYNDDEIDKLVEKIVNKQVDEDQFINAPITFRQITEAKEVFKTKLKNIYHARVEYPSIKKKKKQK